MQVWALCMSFASLHRARGNRDLETGCAACRADVAHYCAAGNIRPAKARKRPATAFLDGKDRLFGP